MDEHDSRRRRLRSATHRLHERLDTVVEERAAILHPDRYAEMLEALAGCHRWAETHLRALPDLDRSGHAAKVALALEDLETLGIETCAIDGCRGVTRWPAPSDRLPRNQLLGMLYVIEGSTLGGRVLADRVTRQLPSAPTGFLRCYGDDVVRRWTRTVRFLNSSIDDDQQAAAGARLTFDYFLEALG